MNFKKLLTMLTITFFASSGTMATINIQGSNTKLIKNSLINNHESFSKLKGTSGVIWSVTSDQNGNIYVANDEGTIYSSENNEHFKQIFKSEGTIKTMVTSQKGNVYAAIKTTENKTNIYMKNNDSTEFELFQTFDINLLSMTVYTSNDGDEYLYMGTDRDVQAYYQTEETGGWLQVIDGTVGEISTIVKSNNNDKCIYAGTTDGKIYKTIGGDQAFEEVLATGDKITDLTIDNLENLYATEISGQVWKKDNIKNNFARFQLQPLSSSLISIVTDNDNNIYASDSYGNLWKSYGSSTFSKFQIESNISVKKIIFNSATDKIYVASSAGVYYSN